MTDWYDWMEPGYDIYDRLRQLDVSGEVKVQLDFTERLPILGVRELTIDAGQGGMDLLKASVEILGGEYKVATFAYGDAEECVRIRFEKKAPELPTKQGLYVAAKPGEASYFFERRIFKLDRYGWSEITSSEGRCGVGTLSVLKAWHKTGNLTRLVAATDDSEEC